MTATMDRLIRHAEIVSRGEHEKVRPGMPWSFTNAAQAGDGCWQGDLGLEILDSIPKGYVLVKKPVDADRQLVPGQTQGEQALP